MRLEPGQAPESMQTEQPMQTSQPGLQSPQHGPDLRLASPALAAWVAALLGAALPAAAGWVAVGAAAAALLLLVALHRIDADRSAALGQTVAFSLAAVALVSTVVMAQAPGRQPVTLIEHAEARRPVEASGWVSGHCRLAAPSGLGATGQLRCPSVLETWSVPDADGGTLTGSGSVPVQLVLDAAVLAASVDAATADAATADAATAWPQGRPGYGARFAVEGRLQAWPSERQQAFRLQVIALRAAEPPPAWLGLAEGLRAGLRETAAGLPGWGGELLPGLAIGDTTAVGEPLDAAMKSASLSHLTAVSGANCAVVVAAAFLVAGRLGAGRRGRVAAAVAVLAAFIVLVTPEPSVLRAGTMTLIALAAALGGRPGRGVAALGASVLVLLAVDPWLGGSAGFALSVAATAGLLLLAGPLTRQLARWLPTPLAAAIALPLAAQLACQPLLILLEPEIPLWGVPANLLAAPAAPLATGLGLLACLALPLLPWAGAALAGAAWLPAAWIGAAADLFGGRMPLALPWAEGWPGALLLAVLIAAGLIALLGRAGLPRRLLRLALTAGLVVAVGAALGGAVGRAASTPHDWRAAACDVGQGDAVLVRGGGATALVDTGEHPQLLAECLAVLGIGRLDLLVLSHFDADHVGGAAAVVGRVELVLHGPPGSAADAALLARFRAAGAETRQAQQGDRGALGSGLAWRVLWPPTGGVAPPPGNAASIVTEFLAPDGYRTLLLGDLGLVEQYRLRLGGLPRRVDLVKVAHHGSADQDPALYAELRAPVGLITVGAGNRYGHPTPALLGMLAEAGTAALRTDERGLILVSGTPGGPGRIWSER